jgi:hypothetical protein
MRPVTIPWYGRVSGGCFGYAFDFDEKEERTKEGRRHGPLEDWVEQHHSREKSHFKLDS